MIAGRRSSHRHRQALLLAVSCFLAPLVPAKAAELADLVPADALLHIEWHGLPDGSRPTFSVARLLEALAVAGDASDDERSAAVAFGEVVDMLATSPCSLTLLDIAIGEAGPDVPVLLIARAGDQVNQLSSGFEKLIEGEAGEIRGVTIGSGDFNVTQMPDLPMPLYWGTHDDMFIIALGERAVNLSMSDATERGPTLSASEEFKHVRAAMSDAGEQLVLSVYFDTAGTIQKAKTIAQAMTGGELPPMVDTVLNETGINSVLAKGAQCSITQDGLWRLSGYAHAPRPRKGILEFWEQRPLTNDDFAFVPSDAYFMKASTWDIDRSFKSVLDTLGRIDPGYPPMLSNVYNMSLGMLGVHPVDDLIAKTGDTWVIYDAPSHGGLFCLGSVLVMTARDADGLHKSLDTIAARAAKMAAEEDVNFEAKRITAGGHEMTQLAFKGVPVPVAPSWGVIGNRVVVGLFPQMVAATMDEIKNGPRPGPLAESANFKAMRGRLPKDAQSLAYLDDKTILRWVYPLQLFAAQAISSGLSASGVDMNVAAIPTIDQQLAATPNSMAAVSANDDGIHVVVMAPGSWLSSGVSTLAGVTSVQTPAPETAKAAGDRSRSLVNLRQIGQACLIYANDQRGTFPPNLETLVDIEYLTAKSLHSPVDDTGQVSYVYVTGLKDVFEANQVIAYERPDLADGDGVAVLLGDGHVEMTSLEELKGLLYDTYSRLGRLDEMPEWARE